MSSDGPLHIEFTCDGQAEAFELLSGESELVLELNRVDAHGDRWRFAVIAKSVDVTRRLWRRDIAQWCALARAIRAAQGVPIIEPA